MTDWTQAMDFPSQSLLVGPDVCVYRLLHASEKGFW